MYKVEFSPRSLKDLANVNKNISNENGYDNKNKKLNDVLIEIKGLQDYPYSGVDLGKKLDVPSDYRYSLIKENYVFYHIEDEKVRIARVLNKKQEYLKQLLVNI